MNWRAASKLLLAYAVLVVFTTAPSVAPRDVALELGGTLAHVPPARRVTLQPEAELRAKPLMAPPRPPHGPEPRPRFVLRATGYNSEAAQTDSTPFVTATGAATAPGTLAVSRDLLARSVPYGSLVRLRDLGTYEGNYSPGALQGALDAQGLFVVEDTLHPRKTQQVDIWFETRGEALTWGVRQVELEVVRYGRSGPIFPEAQASFPARPRFGMR